MSLRTTTRARRRGRARGGATFTAAPLPGAGGAIVFTLDCVHAVTTAVALPPDAPEGEGDVPVLPPADVLAALLAHRAAAGDDCGCADDIVQRYGALAPPRWTWAGMTEGGVA